MPVSGDLEDARRFLDAAERSVRNWGESSWQAAVLEAEATVALAEGDTERYRRLSREAADAYAGVGHLEDAARCLAAESPSPPPDRRHPTTAPVREGLERGRGRRRKVPGSPTPHGGAR